MYKKIKPNGTTLKVNSSYQGETIEQKVNRIVNNKEPITDGAPIIYQERKEGVNPAYDIRTDRFEIAVEAMDKVSGSHKARRENTIAEKAKKGMEAEQKSGGESSAEGAKVE